MAGIDGIPESTRAQVEQLGAADVVIGLAGGPLDEPIAPAVAAARQAVERLPDSNRTVIVYPARGSGGEQTPSDGPPDQGAAVRELACPLPIITGFPDVNHLAEVYRKLFSISMALGARSCWVLSSLQGSAITELLHELMAPMSDHNLDVIVPLYVRRRFDGLINSGVAYPLTRALYGKRIHSPMSPDLGVSARFMERWLQQPSGGLPGAGAALLMTTIAVREGFQVGQVQVGASPIPPRDTSDLSTVLSQVLDSLFTDIENTAAIWQRTRGSQPVPTLGKPGEMIDDSAVADVRKLIDAFQLGYKNLLEVWGRFLPPETLVELKRVTRMPAERFHLADEHWARIIYDCALGHRLRVISRDHLLRSMTPIYLAWVASYIVEVQNLKGSAAVQERIERLCTVYEQQKSYLVSRWRWPERSSR